MQECDARIVVDGRLLASPPSVFRQVQMEESRSIEMPIAEVSALGGAQRFVADLCGKRIELGAEHFALIQQFVMQFNEEVALTGPAQPDTTTRPIDGQGSL
jgi:hypothetical protein